VVGEGEGCEGECAEGEEVGNGEAAAREAVEGEEVDKIEGGEDEVEVFGGQEDAVEEGCWED